MDLRRGFYTVTQLSNNKFIDNDGALVCRNAILGKAGEQKYAGYELGLDSNEIILIDRPYGEVFDKESLSSLRGKMITLDHPGEDVGIDNMRELSKGFVLDAWQEGHKIVGDIKIIDQEVIDLITSGDMVELSLGYETKLEHVGDNRLKQKEIVYNHLALVKRGRAEIARIVDNSTINVRDKMFDEGGEHLETKKQGLLSKIFGAIGAKEQEIDGKKVYVVDEATNEVVEDPTSVEETQPETPEDNPEEVTLEDGKSEEEPKDEPEEVTLEDNKPEETPEVIPEETPEPTPNKEEEPEETTKVADNATEEGDKKPMDAYEKMMKRMKDAEGIEDADFRKQLQDQAIKEYTKETTEATNLQDGAGNEALEDFGNVTLEDSDIEEYDFDKEYKKMLDELNPHNYETYPEYVRTRKKMDREATKDKIQDLVDEAFEGGIK